LAGGVVMETIGVVEEILSEMGENLDDWSVDEVYCDYAPDYEVWYKRCDWKWTRNNEFGILACKVSKPAQPIGLRRYGGIFEGFRGDLDLSLWDLGTEDVLLEGLFQGFLGKKIILPPTKIVGKLNHFGLMGDSVCIDRMFLGCENLEEVNLEVLDVSQVNSMQQIFSGCRRLFNPKIEEWDFGQVRDTRDAMKGCFFPPEVGKRLSMYDDFFDDDDFFSGDDDFFPDDDFF